MKIRDEFTTEYERRHGRSSEYDPDSYYEAGGYDDGDYESDDYDSGGYGRGAYGNDDYETERYENDAFGDTTGDLGGYFEEYGEFGEFDEDTEEDIAAQEEDEEESSREERFFNDPDFDPMRKVRAQIRRRKNRIRLTVMIILGVILLIVMFFLAFFKVRNVIVNGNTRYTDQEITDIVEDGFLGDNSLVLSFRYRNREMPEVPFVESMTVKVLSHDTIQIDVYEKSLAGYVSYLGGYMYFARDGTVVESSTEKLDGIPEVTGLKFSNIALYQKLPVDDLSIFDRILDISQILSKYGLTPDKIYFDDSSNMSVYFGDIQVELGQDEYVDEKVSNLKDILPSLKGKAGTLEMADYTPETHYVTFTLKNQKSN